MLGCLTLGSAEGRSPLAEGLGVFPQYSKSPKTGGLRGLKSVKTAFGC